MAHKIGIRHEDKYVMERRAPLTPSHVEKLINTQQLEFVIQSSPKRVFTDDEYKAAGATVADNLNDCEVIIGVKEMPESFFEKGKTYIFFSHVIKGQPYNMPMLRKMMDRGCNLIDYEKVVDEQGKRLIFFGRFAGLAGMINSLWSLGVRLEQAGYKTPFSRIKQSHTYHSLDEVRKVISDVGLEISQHGLPNELCPLTVAFTGYGNVSQGAQEIMSLLPALEIMPEQLLNLKRDANAPNNVLYKVVFKEEHLVEPIDSTTKFELYDYFTHPEKYKSAFEKYLPHVDMLINCVYWDIRYPRLLTKEYLKNNFGKPGYKLKVVGDISCDVNGSVECTEKGTEIEDPVFVYYPDKDNYTMGFEGNGVLVMAVDILPSELPRDSSYGFANVLAHYIKAIANCDFSVDYKTLALPAPIKSALILHNGRLTPPYVFLENHVNRKTE